MTSEFPRELEDSCSPESGTTRNVLLRHRFTIANLAQVEAQLRIRKLYFKRYYRLMKERSGRIMFHTVRVCQEITFYGSGNLVRDLQCCVLANRQYLVWPRIEHGSSQEYILY